MTQTAFLTPTTTRARGHWYIIDAQDQVLGRLATHIASLLRGKFDPMFTPHAGSGNSVVVINASKIRVTGDKMRQKIYTRYSGYPGGLSSRTLEQLLAEQPKEVIYRAVHGMLPKNPLGRELMGRLHIYPGAEHEHQAQQPTPITTARGFLQGLQ